MAQGRLSCHLQRLLDDFAVRSSALGAVYVGYGRVPAGRVAP
jgi:hypothetical protein